MARVARVAAPCVPRDVFASTGDVDDPPAALAAEGSAATASCCRALSEAVGRAVATEASPQLGASALPLAVDTLAARRGPRVGSEAVRRGISEALRVLQEAVLAAEATQEMLAQGRDAFREATDASALGGRLVASLLEADVPAELVACLGSLCFEARKDAMRLFTEILRYAVPFGAETSLLAYFQRHPTILQLLLEGCADSSVFAHCAQMLRGCTRHPQLVTALLRNGAAARFLELAKSQNFEISSEAFATLREILLTQRAVSAPIISASSNEFFADIHVLLGADMGYVVRRQALRLLGEVLLDPAFRGAMHAYIVEDRFLQIHMNAMRDSSKAIQLGGFHIFKIFVANPKKPHNVHSILHRNRDRLLKLLLSLSVDCRGDGSLMEDFSAVIALLEALEAPPMKRGIS